VLAFVWNGWPYKLGLLAAVIAGVLVGMMLSMRDREKRPALERAK
jgi:uncharacterized integral membrane protein